MLDNHNVGSNQIDSKVVVDLLSRLLVKSDGIKPAGKMAKSRVNRHVVRLSYVPSVSPEEIM
jgi:hypothetical protein